MWIRPFNALAFAVGAGVALPAAAGSLEVSVQDLSSRHVEILGSFRLRALEREPGQFTWLDLRPVQIFTPDARLVLNDGVREQAFPPPDVRHYVGSERGQPGAMAFVSLHPDGSIRGWLRGGRAIEAFGVEPGQIEPARIREVEMSAPAVAGRRFECGSDRLPPLLGWFPDDNPDASATTPRGAHGMPTHHVVPVAIDTDVAYLAQFGGNTTDAARYVADLIGVVSATYAAEIQTSMQLSYVRLWTGGSDPWSESGLLCRLYQFGKYWNDEMTHVPRGLAHLVSGGSGGGYAWPGTLCRSNLTVTAPAAGCDEISGTSNYGGHYGVSAGIVGSLDPGDPQVVWDLVVVAHELGHNFNSPHTHCYANIGGNPDPIDRCFNAESGANCHAGSQALPGPQGEGSGTIMSYCHLRAGGITNISNTLGTGHPFGVEPGRVPTRMRARVESVAVSFPDCLATDAIFENGFEGDPDS